MYISIAVQFGRLFNCKVYSEVSEGGSESSPEI